MNWYDTHYNGAIALVDLAEGALEVVPLERFLAEEYLGGAALNRALLDRYSEGDPLVFGTGPLTGSFAPASCLLTATFRSPMTGRVCNVPLTLRTGPQLKYAGFDALVLVNRCAASSLITVSDGKAALSSAEALQGLGLSQMEAHVRREANHPEAWILAGPVEGPCAAVSTSMGGSFDKAGLSAAMTAKKLRGIAISGSGGRPFGDKDLYRSDLLIETIKKNVPRKQVGFTAILDAIAPGETAKMVPRRKTRNMACFRCPVPCMGHLPRPGGGTGKVGDDVQGGLFLADHLGFTALAKRFAGDAPALMAACNEAGIDPAALPAMISQGQGPDQILSTIRDWYGTAPDAATEEDRAAGLYGSMPPEERDFFGGGLPPLYSTGSADAWKITVGRSMILGICPLFTSRFPDIESPLLGFLTTDKDRVAALAKTMTTLSETLIKG